MSSSWTSGRTAASTASVPIPYLNLWYSEYHDQGLEIIGVHTPEFQFEHDINNVRMAVQKFGIQYPVVLDNNYATWDSYGNRYWPEDYLIDIDGFIVYHHIGEGDYNETEAEIQDLLRERAGALGLNISISNTTSVPSDAVAVNFSEVGSPETVLWCSTQPVPGKRECEHRVPVRCEKRLFRCQCGQCYGRAGPARRKTGCRHGWS